MNRKSECSFCNKPAEKRCSNCNMAYYCNSNHQQKHWKDHKNICRPFKQVYHHHLGRYLVASRDIEAGTLLLKESPIVLGPPACSILICIGCYKPIIQSDFYKCPQCSWPACSEDCLTISRHEPECGILRKDALKCGIPFDSIETPRYDLILIVRCLLLKKEVNKWQLLQSLESHFEKRKSDPYHCAAVRYLMEICKVEYDKEEVHHTRGMIITNSINTRSVFGTTVRGIYPNISMFNHSCLPNITLRSDKHHTIYVHSTVKIKKGEELHFSYVPVTEPLWKRNEDLKNIYFFDCNCIRCSSPHELGSDYSNIKCPTCRNGNMRKTKQSVVTWECCSHCIEKMSIEDVIIITDDIIKELSANKSKLITKEDLQYAIGASLSHTNHYSYLSLLQELLNKKMVINPSIAELGLKIHAWKEIIRILAVLEPGLTRRRGVSLVELSSLLIASLKEVDPDLNKSKQSQLPEDEVKIEEIRAHVEEALVILRLEPVESTELKWLQLAENMKEKFMGK